MFGFGKKKKDVILENELGSFKLIVCKNHSYYDGYAVWHGTEDKILATVNCDENGSADKGFKRLSEIVDSSAELEKALLDYTLKSFIDPDKPGEPIEIWGSGDDEDEADTVSPEEFRKRISMGFINVDVDGESLDIDIDLDGMFTDHAFMIFVDKDGNFSDNGIYG